MTSHYGETAVRSVYRFTFQFDGALCNWGGWIFHREVYSMTPYAFRHNFWSAGNSRPKFICAQNLTSAVASVPQIWLTKLLRRNLTLPHPWHNWTYKKLGYRWQIANFSTPVYFAPRWRGSPWNWIPTARSGSRTRMMGLSGREKCLRISSVVWVRQHTNVTDGQTDTERQQRPRLRIATRGKNQ